VHTLILGLDAFDPGVFECLSSEGKLPNLTKYVDGGGYRRCEVANPPQTEVSWTSIATGLNPGGHGIFDFVHRDPATYTPYVSLLPTKRGLGGTQFVPPYQARTIFAQAVEEGFPATVLWWPATFPARPESPLRTIPGLGTPDIRGRLGVGTLLSTSDGLASDVRKTSFELLTRCGKGRYTGQLRGPIAQKRRVAEESAVEVQLELADDKSAHFLVGQHPIELIKGAWSPILEVSFKMGPLLSIRSLTRVILTQTEPDIRLYVLPLQIHPMHSLWRYATPRSLVKQVWASVGPFLTLGWPQDTTALEEGHISEGQFLDLCESIFGTRERTLMHQLSLFHEGLLASVFDTLDRVQHMFWRDRRDVVHEWYVKLDTLVGRVERRLADLGQETIRIVILSDHGFTDFEYKVHLNRWLQERGYLVSRVEGEAGSLKDADWSRSQAYAVGLNSMYVNLAGREGQGSVPLNEYVPLVEGLMKEMLSWQGPDGRPVVEQLWRQAEVFQGSLSSYGPDLVIGFTPGYRASAETGLGRWKGVGIEPNRDRWGGDHCVTPNAVPGVLFSNQAISQYTRPSYRDIPMLTIGAALDSCDSAPPPPFSEEDEEIIQERLRGLGYL
jgi:predicted AlkP superfamily phosphohydrolase/phosphomutase